MTKMRLQESQNFCEALEQKVRDAELRNQSLDQKFQVSLPRPESSLWIMVFSQVGFVLLKCSL